MIFFSMISEEVECDFFQLKVEKVKVLNETLRKIGSKSIKVSRCQISKIFFIFFFPRFLTLAHFDLPLYRIFRKVGSKASF